MKLWALVGLGVVAAGGGAALLFGKFGKGAISYRTAKTERGNLLVSVMATGIVSPFIQVQVGTQVTGTIKSLCGVDFNSRVKKGEKVAEIDDQLYNAQVEQNRANLLRAQADVLRVQALLTQSDKDLKRAHELRSRELISAADMDAAEANHGSLQAQLDVAKATVTQNEAVLKSSQVNLDYCTIRSPIDGVVVSRNVDVGQTVAASLSAPTIFVIANDLKKVQVQASVAEADIGRVSVGQKVDFTVDSYRDVKFEGKVSQVRLQPTTVQNVVTYTVMVDADNPEEKLLPGMTANVVFEVAEYDGVLKVPNAALRFVPPTEHEGENGKAADRPGPKSSKVWIVTPEGPKPVPVTTGPTDGQSTQIVKGDVREGEEVIIGVVQEGRDSSMQNPFGPQRRR